MHHQEGNDEIAVESRALQVLVAKTQGCGDFGVVGVGRFTVGDREGFHTI